MAEAIRTIEGTAAQQPKPTRISRTFHAPIETAFKAWSAAEHVSRWFAPAPYTVPEAVIEMRVGGRFDVCMQSPQGDRHWTRGTFVEVVPNKRLIIDMRATTTDGAALFRAYTEVEFSEAMCGSQIDVVQTYTLFDPVTAAPMVGGAQQGWTMALDQLETVVVAMQGGAGIVVRSVAFGTFHLERTYDAPVGRVWKALTDEAAKAKWFSGTPDRWELVERQMDVRPGGTEILKGRWEGGVVSTFDAVYHDVIPHERLVYSYQMFMDDKKISVSLATMQLIDRGSKTTLKITEQGAFLDGYDDAGSREHGTGFLLDQLGASLED